MTVEGLLSLYLPAFVLSLGAGVALPAIPELALSFDVSFGVASGVTTAFVLGNLAGALPCGYLIDRFGRRPVTIAGPLLTGLMALLVLLSTSFTELLIFRFLDGVAAQMWMMGRLAKVSASAGARQRGRQVSWMFGMDATGRLTGPLVGGVIATAWGPRAPFALYAIVATLAVIPVLVFRDTGDRPAKRTKKSTVDGPRVSRFQLIRTRVPQLGLALFAGMARGPAQAGLLHLYAAFTYRLGPGQIALLATGASVISLPIGFVSGWSMDRFGRKRTMVPGFAGVGLAMVGLAIAAALHLSLVWYAVIFFLGTAAQGLTSGSVQTIGVDVAPETGRGTFLGIWRFTGQGGVAIGPIVFALLAEQLDYAWGFAFIALAASGAVYLLAARISDVTRSPAPVVAAATA